MCEKERLRIDAFDALVVAGSARLVVENCNEY
jgi:hypothetical protein